MAYSRIDSVEFLDIQVDIDELRQILQDLKLKNNELITTVFNLAERCEEVDTKNAELTQKILRLEDSVEDLRRKNEDLDTTNKDFYKRVVELETSFKGLQEKLAVVSEKSGQTVRKQPQSTTSGSGTNIRAVQRNLGPNLQRKYSSVTDSVAFYAQLDYNHSDEDKTLNQVLKFGNVIENNGGGYNPTDGIFTVKTPGIYVFYWSGTVDTGDSADLVLSTSYFTFNGACYADQATATYNSSSNMAILKLNTGTKVWIRQLSGKRRCIRGGYSTFSGFLLQ